MAICSLSCLDGYTQNLQQTFELAESYLAFKQFEAAAETYERLLFFDQEGKYRNACLEQLGDSYVGMGAYKLALKNYNFAYFQAEEEVVQQRLTFKLIQAYLLNNDPNSAQEELFQMEGTVLPDNQAAFLLYSGVAAFAREDFENAQQYFHQYLSQSPPEVHEALDALFVKNEKVSRISSKKARTLSTIFPGLGQFYLGNVKSGLNSFLLTTGLIGLTVYAITVLGPLDGFFLGLPWLVRYYQGGFKQAGRLAEDKKMRDRGEIYQAIMDLVISQYKGS
ncbi:MAG: tetratricopeptide repeat protein [Bacteroidota bacterium]